MIRGGARSEEILDASHVGSDQAVVIMWRKADTVKRVFAAALESVDFKSKGSFAFRHWAMIVLCQPDGGVIGDRISKLPTSFTGS